MRVAEIFTSVEGEGPKAGYLSNFIRLAGCNLNCTYCDTAYAKEISGDTPDMTAEEISGKLNRNIKNITLTGGEPFARKKEELRELLDFLSTDYDISVETNGTGYFSEFHSLYPDIIFIVDYKLPGSGMEHMMKLRDYFELRKHDAVKFVASDYSDLVRMTEICEKIRAESREMPELFVSPVFSRIAPLQIADFIKKRNLGDIRLQLQLHKCIWSPETRGV